MITWNRRLNLLNCDTYIEPNIVCMVLYTSSTATPNVSAFVAVDVQPQDLGGRIVG